MSQKVLFVDDEPNVLDGIRRSLRNRFSADTATSGSEALDLLHTEGPYAVIVSDMQMPVMNGVELLSRVKQQAPDTVRIMLTGNADQETAVEAVNKGDIFRFLNKPCGPEKLTAVLQAALQQYRLIVAEKELLDKTLRGSIQALTEVLALTNPEIFGRTTRLKQYMRQLATEMGLDETWQLETVALLSLIGCVIVPEPILLKKTVGGRLDSEESKSFAKHAKVGADLLTRIPRLEQVAECILYQRKGFDGSGFPEGGLRGASIPLGARLMKVILDFDDWESAGLVKAEALAKLQQRADCYDPDVLAALAKVLDADTTTKAQSLPIAALADGMLLAEDIKTNDGLLLVCRGQEATSSVRAHLMNVQRKGMIDDSVIVWAVD